MINLTGKDLSGLARGTEIFKSVKRADARLNSDEVDGFTDLAEMTKKENVAYPGKCPKCKGPLTKHPSGPYGGMPFCAACGEVWYPEDIKNAENASDDRCEECHHQCSWHSNARGMGSCIGKKPDGSKCACLVLADECRNGDEASMYPHDILPNTKDGLKRGAQKYGAVKNSDEHPVYLVKYDGPYLKDLEVSLHMGPMTDSQIEQYFKQHYVQPTKIKSIQRVE